MSDTQPAEVPIYPGRTLRMAPLPPPPQAPSLPKALSDRALLQRLRQAGALLWPEAHADVQLARALLAFLGAPQPRAETVPDLVRGLCAGRWQAIPSALEAPRPGDVWVRTGEGRIPERFGFVGAIAAEGWFRAVSSEEERLTAAEVDFLLRPPGT